jgi:LPXTG-motif cell wall-anchored protein
MKQYFNFNWYLLLCLLAFTYKGKAQDIRVEAKLDKTSIALGDQTRLHLIVRLPVKSAIDFPVLADTISSKVQVVETGKTDTLPDKDNPGIRTISRQYTITSFEAGLHMIPAYTFHGKDGSFNTSALPLEVTAVKVDTTKAIYDIKEPLAVSYSFMDWLRDHWHWVLFPLLGVMLLAGLLYYFLKKRKNKPVQVQEVKPFVPFHTVALDKLRALKGKKLWEQGQIKPYHSELTDIIREYLEKRYGLNAMEQTSEEIFSGLRHLEIAEQDMNKLRQMLILADLVKFAKEKPLNTDNEQSMENAISFVTNTKAVINPLPENKAQNNDNEPV